MARKPPRRTPQQDKSPRKSTATGTRKTQTPRPASTPWWQRETLWVATLVLATFLAYWNSVYNGYALDDYVAITQNRHTLKGFDGLEALLVKDSLNGYLGDNSEFTARYYRPLSFITFALEIGMLGPDKPHVSHFINILLFAATVVLVFFLIRRFIAPQYPALAFITALLFAVHPIHTEAVTNLKGRDEILTYLCMLGALYLALQAATLNPGTWIAWLVGACTVYILALFSKESAFAFLGILPLTLVLFRNYSLGRAILFTLPFVAMALLFLWARMEIVGFTLENPSTDYLGNFYYQASFVEKYATIAYVMARYLILQAIPHPLSWNYSYSEITYKTFSHPYVILSLLIHVGGLIWALIEFVQVARGQQRPEKRKLLAFGILYYWGTIFIVSNIVINIGGYVGERFVYQASLAFVFLIALGLVQVQQQFNPAVLGLTSARHKPRQINTALIGICIGIWALLGIIKTIDRNRDWEDNETLFLQDVLATPRSAMVQKAAGMVNRERGQRAKNPQKKQAYFEKSEYHLKRAIRIFPEFIDAYIELGLLAYAQGDIDAEESWYKKGLSYNEKHGNARNNLAKVYITRANQASEAQDYGEAIHYARQALELQPRDAVVYSNLGLFYAMQGKLDSSIQNYTRATELNPQSADNWYGLGWAHYQAGNTEEMRQAWKRTLQINPDHQQRTTIEQFISGQRKQPDQIQVE